MVLNAITADIAWITSQDVQQQLYDFWQKLENNGSHDRHCITLRDLQDVGISLDCEAFYWLMDPSFCVLCWVSSQEHAQSELSLAFSHQAIAELMAYLEAHNVTLPGPLSLFKPADLPERFALPPELIVGLLEIVRPPHAGAFHPSQPEAKRSPLGVLLKNHLKQEKILNNITHCIYQSQDLPATIEMALAETRQFMQLDRLMIYQLRLSDAEPQLHKAQITFEVTASPQITPVLHFDSDSCFSQSPSVRQRYTRGEILAIDDVQGEPKLNHCLKQQLLNLQVKAKLAVPLVVEQELWGLLIAHQCYQPRHWHKEEVAFLGHVAEYLAIAILQANSYQQLQAHKTHLELIAQQRARELEDALLSAQAASQSKKEFIHIMSHELLTPLTSIIGLSNTLSIWNSPVTPKTLAPEQQETYLKTIAESGIRLRNLLQDILDFSQVEAARLVLDIRRFSLTQLCNQTLSKFQDVSDRQGITLKILNKLVPDQDIFSADSVRIARILSHLLSNALKFTPNGGEVTLTVWREQQEDVIFEVADTGIGIASQQISLLFEQFQQLEPSMSRRHDGAGFGLALVKQLVEIHQGDIHVVSKPNKGSTFVVRIPNQIANRRLDKHRTQSAHNGGNTIILISQEEDMATLICELLTASNYQVIWLIDPEIDSQQIATFQPALVILDSEAQNLNVETVLQGFNTESTQMIPVLLFGDRHQSQAWKDLQPYGCEGYIPKPLQSEELIKAVNHHVQRSLRKRSKPIVISE